MPSLIIKNRRYTTMSGKYMKIKRVIIPTLTMVLLSSMLFGCSAATKEETYDMLQQSTEIELEYAVPEYDTTEDSAVELLPWLQLSSLETHPELRAAFEEYLSITGETGNKEGTLYYNPLTTQADQNITLLLAIKNSQFRGYVIMPDALSKLGEIATENYADLEADDINAPYATINAYFELLPDQTEGQFDGDSTISRAQAMALVMRATTPVNESQAPETNNDFTSVVGESQYTNFAAPMDEYSYINTENGLNEQSFNGTMTKGEYIALVTNYIRADYISTLEEWGYTDLYSDTSDVTISTVSDAGNIKYSEAIADASKGVPTDLYETFKLAIKNGYLAEADLEDWDSALTKVDAVSLFISMATNYTSNVGNTMVVDDTTPTFEIVEQGDYPDTRSDHQKNWDIYKNYFDDFSVYGTDTAGKEYNDLPYCGDTGYDPKGTILQERTTDKGYTVMYDTNTGKVYYSSMILPTGSGYDDLASSNALVQYILDNDIFSVYDLTYTQYQEILGVYNGN